MFAYGEVVTKLYNNKSLLKKGIQVLKRVVC